ncbi:hypothetical protein CPB83DRAFT_265409 [Crepidotus variabilis]|uniref:Uncharacterized protein n=1 Tax=Crepidotus variabilis TaxID=179855 RepID=A0A9P6EIC0_9AGAR|nr:hypothetical protein CPB83DRAFT_265409 [Crepidotus variabilis]
MHLFDVFVVHPLSRIMIIPLCSHTSFFFFFFFYLYVPTWRPHPLLHSAIHHLLYHAPSRVLLLSPSPYALHI